MREAGAGQAAAAVFPSCFPVVPLSSTSSCFYAIKFFPGEIRARPPHPGVSRVLVVGGGGGEVRESAGSDRQRQGEPGRGTE